MRRILLGVCGSALVLSMAVVSRADSPAKEGESVPETTVFDAQSAFNYLKTLAGDWGRGAGDHEHGASARTVSFRVSGAGSMVVETYYEGQANEMLSIYHMNGDELLMTHYCALRNAPVMKFVKSDKPGEIKFAFEGGTNFDPKVDAHVHEGTLRVRDANTLESDFITFAGGAPRPNAKALMKRKPAN